MPWYMQALEATVQRHIGRGVVYLLQKVHVIGVPGLGNEGGYRAICKVRISMMANISIIIDFA